MMAQLVGYTVTDLMKTKTNWLEQIADVKRINHGEKAMFRVQNNGITAFIQAKGSTTARSKVSYKQAGLDTISVSARPFVNIVEFQAGRVSMADLITQATDRMEAAYLGHIEGVLASAASSWSAPFYGSGSGIIAATIKAMSQHWMRTGGVTLLGDIRMCQMLANESGFTHSEDAKNELMRTGMIGYYYGAKVAQMNNPYGEDGVTPQMKIDRFYFLPSGANVEGRPLKVVFEGGIESQDATNIDDRTYEIRLDMDFGAGVFTGVTPQMSVYVDSNA